MRVEAWDEEGMGEQELTYSVSSDGQRLTLSQDVFGPSATEFMREMTKP
jgi:hypothetical protein